MISNSLLRVQFQKDIFRFQISVGQPHLLMHKLNSLQRLPRDVLDLMERKPVVFVAFNELIKTLAKSFKNEACLYCLRALLPLLKHERLFKVDDVVFATAFIPNVFKDFDLNFSRLVVSFDGSDHFHSVVGLVL
jgi:hypothetical protein